MLGGLVRGLLNRREKNEEIKKDKAETGILYASGLIAGEGLMGVILAALTAAFANPDTGKLPFELQSPVLSQFFTLILFLLVALSLVYIVFKKKNREKA